MYFDELNLNDNILDALDDMRFETCTPIQEKCIPEILDGHDLIGIAQTGTGKTAAYLLPILSLLDDGYYPDDANNCVIMSPTRELAQQIDQAMQGFGYYLQDISSVAVYGGNDGNRYEQEMRGLKLGADVIIATPGRLISHITMGNVDFSRVSFFVLDEADRMLDMGFSEDIMTIAKHLPPTCQIIMFSATMPPKIEQLAKTLLKNPVEVKLAVVKDIARDLKRMHVSSGEMHSDLDQSQRDEMMYRFKSGQIDVLVATDIVARGIDIDDIEMVINYDVPHDAEDYVHRIGRTARANRNGTAITLVRGREIGMFMQIEKFLERTIDKLPLPEGLGEAPEYKPMPVRNDRRGRSFRGKGRNRKSAKGRSNANAKGKSNESKRNKDDKKRQDKHTHNHRSASK